MPLPPEVIRGFGAVLAVVALLLYTVVTAVGIWFSWKTGDPSWITSEGTIFWATGLASLVGGVVAVGFGVAPPPDSDAHDPRPLRGLTMIVSGLPQWSSKIWIAIAYAGVYLVLGILAGVTWATQQGETIDAVRGLASASAGLFFAVVRAWFQD
jgi:hypothetical protein